MPRNKPIEQCDYERGARHHAATLSEAQIAEILQNNESDQEAAHLYGVTRRHIAKIRAGDRW